MIRQIDKPYASKNPLAALRAPSTSRLSVLMVSSAPGLVGLRISSTSGLAALPRETDLVFLGYDLPDA